MTSTDGEFDNQYLNRHLMRTELTAIERNLNRNQSHRLIDNPKNSIGFVVDDELILPNSDFMDENGMNVDNPSQVLSDATNGQPTTHQFIKQEPIDCSDEEPSNGGAGNEPSGAADDSWLEWTDRREVDGTEKLFCKWKDCGFGSHLLIAVKQHVLRHFKPKSPIIEGQLIPKASEGLFWDAVLADVVKEEPLDEGYPQMAEMFAQNVRSKRKSYKTRSQSLGPYNSEYNGMKEKLVKSERKPKVESLTSELIAANIGQNNVILSLKGMASYKKLKDFIELRVVDGQKQYFCKYTPNCPFKTRRTQEICRHIHCRHIGFYLKCVQPNCEKVFRTPDSWREHQKNHICNFGIYGYQKNVLGVCRRENLIKWREPVVLANNQKAFRCMWEGCGQVTGRHIVRHIHNQHICPYRNSDEWKNQFNQSVQYSADTQMADIPLNAMVAMADTRKYFCRRRQCNAHFANEAELKKHENLLCRFRPLAKTGANNVFNKDKHKRMAEPKPALPNPNPKPNDKSNRFVRQTKEGISCRMQNEENVRNSNGQLAGADEPSTSYSAPNWTPSVEPEPKCLFDQYIRVKPFDGTQFYLCDFTGCKFVSKVVQKAYMHIRDQHFGPNGPNGAPHQSPAVAHNQQMAAQKRSVSAIELTISTPEEGNKRLRTNGQSSAPMMSITPIAQSNSSAECSVEHKYINDELNYFCKQNNCKYYTNSKTEMRSHLATHVVFRCDVDGCAKEFKSQNILDVHKRNHICGFGIKGMKSNGVCDLDNVRRYRGEVELNGHWAYMCKWLGCRYSSESRTNVLSHIHNRHICPNRLEF